MVEVEIAGEIEFDMDEEGVEYYRVPLSNGAVLQLYGNGLTVQGAEGFIDYADLVEALHSGGGLLILEEDPTMEA